MAVAYIRAVLRKENNVAHYLVIRCEDAGMVEALASSLLAHYLYLISYKIGDIEDVAFTLDSMQEFINIGNITVLVKKEDEE